MYASPAPLSSNASMPPPAKVARISWSTCSRWSIRAAENVASCRNPPSLVEGGSIDPSRCTCRHTIDAARSRCARSHKPPQSIPALNRDARAVVSGDALAVNSSSWASRESRIGLLAMGRTSSRSRCIERRANPQDWYRLPRSESLTLKTNSPVSHGRRLMTSVSGLRQCSARRVSPSPSRGRASPCILHGRARPAAHCNKVSTLIGLRSRDGVRWGA